MPGRFLYLVLTVLSGGGLAAGAAAQPKGPEASIERFYNLPSVIGTAPAKPAFSPDGRYVAFLWNDEGYPFRDIWLYDIERETHSRLTDLGGASAREEFARGVGEIEWLASSERIAFTFRGDVWLADVDGGEPESLVKTEAGERQLRISPGGSHLAFVREGDLWVQPLSGGVFDEARRVLRTDSNKIFVERYHWSPGGDRIAVILADNTLVPVREIHYYEKGEHKLRRLSRPFPGDETTRRRIAILDITGSAEPLWLEHPEKHPIYGFSWSYAGDRLMVDSSSFLLEHRTIRTYDATSGEAALHYRFTEPRQLNPGWSAAWAPDDDGLIILSDREGWYHLYHQREPEGGLRRLTEGEWEVADFTVDADNARLYFRANEAHRAERQLYRLPVAGGDIERLSTRPGTHEAVYGPDFAVAIDLYSSDIAPPDLYLHRLDEPGTAARVTMSPRPAVSEHDWADVRYIEFDSHVDGAPLIGRLSLPPDYEAGRRYPVIVGSVYADSVRNQWGGRTAHPTWGLDQVLVGRGYVLLNVNVRGSWGQGKAFRQGLLSGYGGIDIDDLESGVRHLVERGIADPERVGIWGSSYGGLMTLMSLFKKPGLYAAGIAGAPATNVWHAYPEQMWVLGDAIEGHFERYRRQAAFYQSEGLEDPVMIIHGSADAVVLYADSLALANRMIEQGKLFELVTLPGGSHAWDVDSLAQARFAFHKMIEFFDRHLKPTEEE